MGMKFNTFTAVSWKRLSLSIGLRSTLLLILIGVSIATIPLNLMIWNDQRGRLQLIALGSCLGLVLLSESRLRRRTQQLSTSQQALIIQQQVLRQKLRTSLTAAAVAHEVNQPLSSLSLISQRLIEQAEQMPQLSKTLPLLQVLHTESQQLVELIEKMRMLLQSVETDQGPVDISDVINASITYLKSLIIGKKVSISFSGIQSDMARPIIYGDGTQLQVAITNLIRNSLAALCEIPDNNRRIDISLQSNDDYVDFSIADNGPGFPVGRDESIAQDSIFSSTQSTGMGLGLYLVSATVENHRGTLKICRSAELGGAEVILRFQLISQQINETKPISLA
jgi:signal transduction histidine kinase